jgi:hypothetical protein
MYGGTQMTRQAQRPVIEVRAYFEGDREVTEAFAQAYSIIFSTKLKEQSANRTLGDRATCG